MNPVEFGRDPVEFLRNFELFLEVYTHLCDDDGKANDKNRMDCLLQVVHPKMRSQLEVVKKQAGPNANYKHLRDAFVKQANRCLETMRFSFADFKVACRHRVSLSDLQKHLSHLLRIYEERDQVSREIPDSWYLRFLIQSLPISVEETVIRRYSQEDEIPTFLEVIEFIQDRGTHMSAIDKIFLVDSAFSDEPSQLWELSHRSKDRDQEPNKLNEHMEAIAREMESLTLHLAQLQESRVQREPRLGSVMANSAQVRDPVSTEAQTNQKYRPVELPNGFGGGPSLKRARGPRGLCWWCHARGHGLFSCKLLQYDVDAGFVKYSVESGRPRSIYTDKEYPVGEEPLRSLMRDELAKELGIHPEEFILPAHQDPTRYTHPRMPRRPETGRLMSAAVFRNDSLSVDMDKEPAMNQIVRVDSGSATVRRMGAGGYRGRSWVR